MASALPYPTGPVDPRKANQNQMGIQLGQPVPGLTGPAGNLAIQLTSGQFGGTPAGVTQFGNQLLNGGGVPGAVTNLGNRLAGGGWNLPSAVNNIGGALANSTLNNPAEAGVNRFAATGGGVNPAMMGAQQIATNGGGVNPAMAGYSQFASGAEVGSNPYLDATYKRAAAPIVESFRDMGAPTMALNASAAGRSGGGLAMAIRNQAEGNVGRTLGGLSNQIYGGAYENERNRQMQGLAGQAQLGQQQVANQLSGLNLTGQLGQQQAANQLAGLGLQNQMGQQDIANRVQGTNMLLQGNQMDLQNRLQGAGLLQGATQQGITNQLAGAGLLNNANQQNVQNQLAGAGLLNQGVQNSFQGIQLGSQLEGQRYNDLNALLGVGNALQQAPWGPAQQYLGVLGGLPGLGGSQTQSQNGGGNPLGQLLGAGLGIAGIAGGLGWRPFG